MTEADIAGVLIKVIISESSLTSKMRSINNKVSNIN